MVKGTISVNNAYVRVKAVMKENQLKKGSVIVNKYYPTERLTITGCLVTKNYDKTVSIFYMAVRPNSKYEFCFAYSVLKKTYWEIY